MPIGKLQRQGRGRQARYTVQAGRDTLEFDLDRDLLKTGWGALHESDLTENLHVAFDREGKHIRNIRRYSPVSTGVREILQGVGCEHPGLLLDKCLYRFANQEQGRGALEQVRRVAPREDLLQESNSRRNSLLLSAGANRFAGELVTPLALHLARASATENACICLHPIYGFVTLPGSGLKGMARCYAETVWLQTQFQADSAGRPANDAEREKARAAYQTIVDVFGIGPTNESVHTKECSWLPKEVIKETLRKTNDQGQAGRVVFHDAWPESWPQLIVDILNNHHTNYYDGKDAPGDWEDPKPVYFLAASPGVTFSFPLSTLRRGEEQRKHLLERAQEWLIGALTHHGAGAKTNSGYGRFRFADGLTVKDPTPTDSARRVSFTTKLELQAPAFLAGPDQQEGDCTLRGASLRGILRWWWRTMHVGFVDLKTLRQLETMVWGSAEVGGAVRLALLRETPLSPQEFNFKEGRFDLKRDFASAHGLPAKRRNSSQGLFYAAYGMDDDPTGKRRRWFLEPPVSWSLGLNARRARFPLSGKQFREVSATRILRQATTALQLFCALGGIGSKSRKGFGSFADVETQDVPTLLANCRQEAREFRQECGLNNLEFREGSVTTSSLELICGGQVEAIETKWSDPWLALDQLGDSLQAFAQENKHQPRKVALGLPRKIHGPLLKPMRHQDAHQNPQTLSDRQRRNRFASPVHFHLTRNQLGQYIVRVTAFVTPDLPDSTTSREVLTELLTHLNDDLSARSNSLPDQPTSGGGGGGRSASAGGRAPVAGRKSKPNLPTPGSQVEAVLVKDPKDKGRPFAKHEPSGLVGFIYNKDAVPSDLKIGDKVTLTVRTVGSDGKQIQFLYPQ